MSGCSGKVILRPLCQECATELLTAEQEQQAGLSWSFALALLLKLTLPGSRGIDRRLLHVPSGLQCPKRPCSQSCEVQVQDALVPHRGTARLADLRLCPQLPGGSLDFSDGKPTWLNQPNLI